MSELVPGQLVRCVVSGLPEVAQVWGASGPTNSSIYTVREVGCFGGDCGIWLVEIVNPTMHTIPGGFMEPGFHASCFIPIDDTAIDILRECLTDVPREVEAA